MTYAEQLHSQKNQYPFDRWLANNADDAAEYAALRQIFDTLLDGLAAAGPAALAEGKVALFKTAIEATNELEDAIMTVEREDLCELTNLITVAAGLNPDDYGGGEGLASEWREW